SYDREQERDIRLHPERVCEQRVEQRRNKGQMLVPGDEQGIDRDVATLGQKGPLVIAESQPSCDGQQQESHSGRKEDRDDRCGACWKSDVTRSTHPLTVS